MYREQAKNLTEQLTVSSGAARSPGVGRASTPRGAGRSAASRAATDNAASPAAGGDSLMAKMSRHATNLAAKGTHLLHDYSAAPSAAPDSSH